MINKINRINNFKKENCYKKSSKKHINLIGKKQNKYWKILIIMKIQYKKTNLNYKLYKS